VSCREQAAARASPRNGAGRRITTKDVFFFFLQFRESWLLSTSFDLLRLYGRHINK
jgi:hypothetical protein